MITFAHEPDVSTALDMTHATVSFRLEVHWDVDWNGEIRLRKNILSRSSPDVSTSSALGGLRSP
ncbi:MAG: hypothetical protein JXM79_06030 [Sedimentisphaerales bacterium]|nr:hypothetical protein [Sedimentisphaerales bacterium]